MIDNNLRERYEDDFKNVILEMAKAFTLWSTAKSMTERV